MKANKQVNEDSNKGTGIQADRETCKQTSEQKSETIIQTKTIYRNSRRWGRHKKKKKMWSRR